MKLVIRLLAFALLVAAGWWAWTFFFPSPGRVILRQLDRVAHLASFTADEGNISRVVNVEKLGNCFADNVSVSVKISGVESFTFEHRSELMQAALAARSSGKSVQARFDNVKLNLAADAQSAEADLAAVATVSGEKEPVVQRLKFSFKKIGGKWVIIRVEGLRMPGE